jgi:hypothetical protein
MTRERENTALQLVATGTVPSDDDFIRSRIFSIHGVQVMLDRDLALLYGVETRVLNQAVKRNADRFPSDLMFQVEALEVAEAVASSRDVQVHSRSHFVTLNKGRGQNIKYRPFAFTEHGIIMLSSVLRSREATLVSLRIVRAFVAMRKFLLENAQLFQRIESVEQRQIATEGKVNEILNRLNTGEIPSQGVFYEGQLWDARALVLKLIESAKRSLILVDNWATGDVLELFPKKRKGVKVTIVTSEHFDRKHVANHKISDGDVQAFNAQYPKLDVRYSEAFHDRFLIIDDRELYLVGASLKDLGRKCFGFTKMDAGEIRRIKKTAFAGSEKAR